MFKKNLANFFNRKFDWWIFFSVFFLSVFSLLALYSLTVLGSMDITTFYKQLFFIILGFSILIFFASLNYNSWKVYNRYLYLIAIVALLSVLFFGRTINGTTGWFYIFGFGIQPVEYVKIVLIISLSNYFSRNINLLPAWRIFLESAFMTFIFVGLVLLQPDTGSALVLVGIWLVYLLVGGIPWKYLLFIFISGIIFVFIAWGFLLADYQKDRLLVFMDPSIDPLGAGYNIEQSMIAIGSGQLLGRGVGLGSQSQLRFIPERSTDFILAVLGEEFGLLGIVLLLLLWAVIFWRLFRLANLASNNFSYLLVSGIAALFFIHVLVNMGMNLGVMPVVGLSLPFISQGGSFLLISFLLIGIVENISIKL